MNFLQLVQRLRQESEIPSAEPSTVVAQTGQLRRLVDWTAQAHNDIQLLHDWRWMRRAFTFNTVIGDDSYAVTDVTDVDDALPISRFSHWWAHDEQDQYMCYLQASGVAQQYRLIYLPWEQFKWQYRFGAQNNGPPIHVSVDHTNNLVLGPKPDAVYVVTGDFQRSAQSLALDADIPEMPTDYHMLIVHYGLEKYGANSVASEIFTRAQLEGARLKSALERNQLPMMTMGEPLI